MTVRLHVTVCMECLSREDYSFSLRVRESPEHVPNTLSIWTLNPVGDEVCLSLLLPVIGPLIGI